ncbi:MAG: ATP-binding protein [Culturomica sp.]|nr:ATP-binding protein [Culturomica sp.]
MKDLSSHILDIVQNSIRANARRIGIELEEDLLRDRLTVRIEDDGDGMDEETLRRVRDPFYTSRTVRKVGLGIPLLTQNAERTGGSVTIESALGKGTVLTATFTHSHLDRPPLGDIAGTLALLTAANPEREFVYRHTSGKGEYRFDTREVRQLLGEVPVNDPEIVRAIRELIAENVSEISEEG